MTLKTGSCGNRSWTSFETDSFEVTFTKRDKRRPDAYSREELVRMLRTVREHEAIQGWKVPDPARDDAESATRTAFPEPGPPVTAGGRSLCGYCDSPRDVVGYVGAASVSMCARHAREYGRNFDYVCSGDEAR